MEDQEPNDRAIKRLSRRWRSELHNVGTEDGEFHVATCGTSWVAEHIVALHNARLEGQAEVNPTPYLNQARTPRDDDHRYHLPPGLRRPATALGQHLGSVNAPAYVQRVADLVEAEVQHRLLDIELSRRASIRIDGDLGTMANVLRMAGYRVINPPKVVDGPAGPVLELTHRGPDNGIALLVDGEEVAKAGDTDSGGGGICWAARGLAHKLGLELIDFGRTEP
jgi:hypothetical protein